MCKYRGIYCLSHLIKVVKSAFYYSKVANHTLHSQIGQDVEGTVALPEIQRIIEFKFPDHVFIALGSTKLAFNLTTSIIAYPGELIHTSICISAQLRKYVSELKTHKSHISLI